MNFTVILDKLIKAMQCQRNSKSENKGGREQTPSQGDFGCTYHHIIFLLPCMQVQGTTISCLEFAHSMAKLTP